MAEAVAPPFWVTTGETEVPSGEQCWVGGGQPRSLRCPAAAAATGAAAAPKQRLVIVGAGICGVSAAYHLSQDPRVTEQYAIAVVDRGWMVGGPGPLPSYARARMPCPARSMMPPYGSLCMCWGGK